MTGESPGTVALVTGGRGGIGRAICRRFEQENMQVFAADLTKDGSLSDDAGNHNSGTFLELDVTDEHGVVDAMRLIEQQAGRLDVVVNAAAIEIESTIEHTSLEAWNRIFAINVTGTFLVCKHALPLLRSAGGGSIVNFGSYDGFIADPELAAYCATKGAVHALTRAMACDHGPENIRVNAVCPGFIDTPMLQSFFQENGDIDKLQDAVKDIHPMRRYGTPEDVANLVNWLSGPEARYASGQLWVLDGGLTAQVQQMKL